MYVKMDVLFMCLFAGGRMAWTGTGADLTFFSRGGSESAPSSLQNWYDLIILLFLMSLSRT